MTRHAAPALREVSGLRICRRIEILSMNCYARSAQVEMQLIISGDSIIIMHMGPHFLVSKSDNKRPLGDGAHFCYMCGPHF